MVVPVSNVDGGVHLDATDFGGQVLADINIVDIIIFNQGADATEATIRSVTIVNVVMPDNMGAHMLLISPRRKPGKWRPAQSGYHLVLP